MKGQQIGYEFLECILYFKRNFGVSVPITIKPVTNRTSNCTFYYYTQYSALTDSGLIIGLVISVKTCIFPITPPRNTQIRHQRILVCDM